MPPVALDATILSMIAGTLLSLLFSYIPGLREKYAVLSEDVKKAIMALTLLGVVIVIAVLSCTGVWPLIECSKVGFYQILAMFVAALTANQGTYSLTPKAASVVAAKEVAATEALRRESVG